MADSQLLHRAAHRAGTRPFFLASLLLPYAAAEGIDEAELARRIGCDPAHLPSLLLCRRPGEGPAFGAEVQEIAARFGAHPVKLAEAVRLAGALEALRSGARATGRGLLAAARDRDQGEAPE